jgi:carbamoyl-phosphate synthase large subunit
MTRTVLVTGVGAVIGYGIVRALRRLAEPPRIVGMDIYPDAVGQHWCDAFVRAVPAADAAYVDFIRQTVATHRVDLILPGIEQDVARLSAERLALADCGARLALNSAELIETAADKWLTHQALTAAGWPAIRTRLDGDFCELKKELGLPFLLKPRRSYASKGIQRLQTEGDLEYWRGKLGDEFMVQEIVGSDEEEYTVGVFGYGDGTGSRQIAFRRMLSGEGATAKAWVETSPSLEAMVDGLVALFRPVGPTNFQLRRHRGEFLLLEVNPRISSSTSLRAAFGFNEAAMCLDYYLDGTKPDVGELRRGFAIRYIEDLVYYDRDHL